MGSIYRCQIYVHVAMMILNQVVCMFIFIFIFIHFLHILDLHVMDTVKPSWGNINETRQLWTYTLKAITKGDLMRSLIEKKVMIWHCIRYTYYCKSSSMNGSCIPSFITWWFFSHLRKKYANFYRVLETFFRTSWLTLGMNCLHGSTIYASLTKTYFITNLCFK